MTRAWRPAALIGSGVLAALVAAPGCNSIVGFDVLEKAEKPVTALDASVTGVPNAFVGGNHTCAIMADKTLRCWGANELGQLGVGDLNVHRRPTVVPNLTGVVFVSLGSFHTCAATEDGRVRCWGGNSSGQLGIGKTDTDPHPQPLDVPGVGNARKVQTGLEHSCAELDNDTVRCWGSNELGQLGTGVAGGKEPTAKVVAGLAGVRKLSSGGGNHTCAAALDPATSAVVGYCWGANDEGQLGAPRDQPPFSATPLVVPTLKGIEKVFVGGSHSCAILTVDSSVWCWGANDAGQLGDGTKTQRDAPQKVPGLSIVGTLGTGNKHSCAFEEPQNIKCWGSNRNGQLGNSDTPGGESLVPVSIALQGAAGASSKSDHACAIVDEKVLCWGANARGQLGDDTTEDRSRPVQVRF